MARNALIRLLSAIVAACAIVALVAYFIAAFVIMAHA
jgi:phage shock protein PspC (stress-responsive transcriptional regulator)